MFSHSPCNTPISIHALRVEGDSLLRRFSKAVLQFLSTPSGWRATARAQRFGRIFCISIHALRVEGDELAEAVNIELAISIHALRVEGD